MSCPSDGDQDGFRNFGSGNGDGQDIATGPSAPAERWHADGPGRELSRQLRRQLLHRLQLLGMQFPTETPISIWPPIPGQPRIGWPGEQGTMLDIQLRNRPVLRSGSLRGMFDVNDGQTVTTRERHRRHEQHHRRRRGPARAACRQQCLGVEFRRERHHRSDQLFFRAELWHHAAAGTRTTGPGAVPTRTQASRAITPAAATSCSSMGPSTSSSSRSTCSRTVPSAAAPAVRSSAPMPTDRTRARSSRSFNPHDHRPGGGWTRRHQSGPIAARSTAPNHRFCECNQDHKTHALSQTAIAVRSVPSPLPRHAGRARPPRHGLLRHRETVSANVIPSPAPSPITVSRSRRATSASSRKT